MHGGMHLCTCVGMHMCVYRCIYVLLSVGMWVYVCVWAWVCISVCFCLSTCMWYECIYVWGMHVCTCTHLCTWIGVWLCVVDVYMSGWVELHVGVCGRIDACVCAEVCTPPCGDMYLWDGEGVAVCVHRNNYIMNHLYKNWSPIQICRYENQSACISVGSVPVRVPPTPVTQAAVLSPAGVMVQILSGEDSRCLLPECAGYMHRKGLVTPLQAQILF